MRASRRAGTVAMGGSHASHLTPLQRPLEAKSLGGSWYIQRGLPAANFLEKHAHNAVETYTLNANGNLAVEYAFNNRAFDGKLVKTYQKGRFVNENNTVWAVRPYLGFLYLPFYLPFSLPYLVIDCATDYSWIVVAAPNRSWMYIMTRAQSVSDESLAPRLDFVRSIGFKDKDIKLFPQQPAAES